MPIAGVHSDWQHHDEASLNLFSAPCAGMQDPEIPVPDDVMEGYRKDMELFRFLRMQGVYGRWIKVFRPTLEHGDPTFVLQRMTWDLEKGLVMISADPLNPLLGKTDRLFIKGLDPEKKYLIESRLGSVETAEKSGAEWMAEGIPMHDVRAGEVLFVNLPDRPGSGSIQEKPAAPSDVKTEVCEWLGHRGVGVSWTAPENDRMISYYELTRDGTPLTRISQGAYFFDDGADGSGDYAVRSVDFDGQTSDWIQ